MTLSQKAVDFTARHQFSTIAGCWALGITGAFGAIMRNPYVGNFVDREMKLTPIASSTHFQVSKLVPKGMAPFVILYVALMTDVYPCSTQIVQARMWSQGITIGVVIAAAAVTRTRMYRRDEGDVGRPVNRDHSWQEIIEAEAEDKINK